MESRKGSKRAGSDLNERAGPEYDGLNDERGEQTMRLCRSEMRDAILRPREACVPRGCVARCERPSTPTNASLRESATEARVPARSRLLPIRIVGPDRRPVPRRNVPTAGPDNVDTLWRGLHLPCAKKMFEKNGEEVCLSQVRRGSHQSNVRPGHNIEPFFKRLHVLLYDIVNHVHRVYSYHPARSSPFVQTYAWSAIPHHATHHTALRRSETASSQV